MGRTIDQDADAASVARDPSTDWLPHLRQSAEDSDLLSIADAEPEHLVVRVPGRARTGHAALEDSESKAGFKPSSRRLKSLAAIRRTTTPLEIVSRSIGSLTLSKTAPLTLSKAP